MIILTQTRTETRTKAGAGAGAGPGAGAGAGFFWSVSSLLTIKQNQITATRLCSITRELGGLRDQRRLKLLGVRLWSQQKIPAPGPAPASVRVSVRVN